MLRKIISAIPRNPWTLLFYGGAIFLLLGAGPVLLIMHHQEDLVSAAQWVEHTQEIQNEVRLLWGDLLQAQSDQRGFIISSLPSYLEKLDLSLEDIKNDLEKIQTLVKDNPEQTEKVQQLRELITKRLGLLQQTLTLQKQGNYAAVQEMFKKQLGVRVMSEIRVVMNQMQHAEHDLLTDREKRELVTENYNEHLLFTLMGLSALLISVSLYLLYRLIEAVNFNRQNISLTNHGVVDFDAYGKLMAESTLELTMTKGRLQAVLDASTQVAIIAFDRAGIITLFNSGAEKLLGYLSVEVVGKSSLELFYKEEEIALRQQELSEERGAPVSGLEALIGAVAPGTHEEREWTYLRKNGTSLTVNLVTTAFLDVEGKLTGFLGVALDVSTRRKAESKIRDQALILDQVNDSVLICDLADKITYWNRGAEKTYGWTSAEAVGVVIRDLLHTCFPRPFEEIKEQLLQSDHWEGELEHSRRDGTRLVVLSHWTLQRDRHQQPSAIIEINRDITERKNAEEKLQEEIAQRKLRERQLEEAKCRAESADRAKSEFLANMSHEIRTPLNGIIGFAQFLANGRPGPLNSRQSEYLGDITNCGKHLLQLINSVLDLARVESGKMEIQLSAFSLERTIQEVCTAVQPLAESKKIALTMWMEPGLDEVRLDQQKLRQILYNLLSNALKFSTSEQRVKVTAERAGLDRLVIKVADTGIGIKTEDLPRLFKEFEQLDSGHAREYEGTGLGLALTRKFVEMQEGTIRVESTLGEGSVFTVELPMKLLQLQ